MSFLAACKGNENEVKNSPLYEGIELTIAVVGEEPKIREKQIIFETINLEDLKQDNLFETYDAVFIMKEHLSATAKASFAKIYTSATLPFIFIETEKSYIPFVEEKTNYEAFPDVKSGDYAYGYYQVNKEEGRYWGYGLYNDTVNEVNVMDVYTRIFETIEDVERGEY
ncbi:hypothetical protein A9C19_09440 [Bacillus weihaiensis]|uniref:Uncharacterized protein n=2 Tax=Bacillus weihaiensis TaxID=1547283 RepID=A0A1L3MXH3_9BACI|nr:hypothetical protein A9C19_09440 [Bacillus weihaiensis]